MFGVHGGRILVFESLNVGPAYEGGAGNCTCDGLVNLILDRQVLGMKVDEGNFGHWHRSSSNMRGLGQVTQLARGVARIDPWGGNVARHHRASADNRTIADGYRHDRRVRPD